MKAFRIELRNLYRGPDKAYSSMDFTGIGHITQQDVMNSLVVKQRLHFTVEELRDFFFLSNMFKEGGMNFDTFKKNFFPHLY